MILGSHNSPVYALCRGNLESQVFSGGGDGLVALWDIERSEQLPFVVRTEAPVFSLFFEVESNVLFIGCSNGKLHAINVATKSEVKAWELDVNGIFDMKPDTSRKRLLVAGGAGILSVIDLLELKVIRSIPLSGGKLRRIAIRPENDLIAVADNSGPVHVLDAENYQTVETIHAHEQGSMAVSWHPSKNVLISGGKDALLRCWNMTDGYKQVLHLAAHQSAIYDLLYHPGKNCFITCSRDKSIKWWDADTFDPLRKLDYQQGGHKHSVNKLLDAGEFVISASDDRQVLVTRA